MDTVDSIFASCNVLSNKLPTINASSSSVTSLSCYMGISQDVIINELNTLENNIKLVEASTGKPPVEISVPAPTNKHIGTKRRLSEEKATSKIHGNKIQKKSKVDPSENQFTSPIVPLGRQTPSKPATNTSSQSVPASSEGTSSSKNPPATTSSNHPTAAMVAAATVRRLPSNVPAPSTTSIGASASGSSVISRLLGASSPPHPSSSGGSTGTHTKSSPTSVKSSSTSVKPSSAAAVNMRSGGKAIVGSQTAGSTTQKRLKQILEEEDKEQIQLLQQLSSHSTPNIQYEEYTEDESQWEGSAVSNNRMNVSKNSSNDSFDEGLMDQENNLGLIDHEETTNVEVSALPVLKEPLRSALKGARQSDQFAYSRVK